MANGDERLESALQAVLATIPSATPLERAFLLKRAGDLCVSMDDRRRALGWYGRSVDQWLELGNWEQAALLCRLIVSVQPEAVRARCTLLWIAIGTRHDGDALQELSGYVAAAIQHRQTTLAAQQLVWMFDATTSIPLREQLVAELIRLGDARAEVLRARLHDASATPADPDQLWARVLDATIGQPAMLARLASTG